MLTCCALDSYSVNKPHLVEQQHQVVCVCPWAWRELVRCRTRAGHHFSSSTLCYGIRRIFLPGPSWHWHCTSINTPELALAASLLPGLAASSGSAPTAVEGNDQNLLYLPQESFACAVLGP